MCNLHNGILPYINKLNIFTYQLRYLVCYLPKLNTLNNKYTYQLINFINNNKLLEKN